MRIQSQFYQILKLLQNIGQEKLVIFDKEV